MINPKKKHNSKIREARKKRGWTQGYLAQITGVSEVYINKLEKGDIPNPGIRNCREIAYALGLRLEDI
ncbi:hypothetical protein ES703_16582 [subsurface metagenome]